MLSTVDRVVVVCNVRLPICAAEEWLQRGDGIDVTARTHRHQKSQGMIVQQLQYISDVPVSDVTH